MKKERITWTQLRPLTAIIVFAFSAPGAINSCVSYLRMKMQEQLCSSPPCFSQPNDHPHMRALQVSHYASTFQNWEGNFHFMFTVMFNDM